MNRSIAATEGVTARSAKTLFTAETRRSQRDSGDKIPSVSRRWVQLQSMVSSAFSASRRWRPGRWALAGAKQGFVVLTVILGCGFAVGGELGARFEVGNGATGAGWFHLSGQVGFATLSGRAEVDLLCGCLRRLVGAASARWEEATASLEASVLSTGRLDLSTTVSWKGLWRTGLGLLSSQAGGKVTWVDLLGGRFLTAAGWGFGRFDREPFWAELNLNVSWPGSSLQAEGRVGLAGPAWLTLVVSGTGVGLELGAEQGWLSTHSYLSLTPAFQTITVGVTDGGVRAQARLTVRAAGSWSAGLNLTATQGPWRGSVTMSFLKSGLEKATVEVRYTLGD